MQLVECHCRDLVRAAFLVSERHGAAVELDESLAERKLER
jgi:hypothetical protein